MKHTCIRLILDAQLQEMCRNLIQDFFHARKESIHYRIGYRTDFENLFYWERNEQLKGKIREVFNSPEMQSYWNNNGNITLHEKRKPK